MHKNSKEENHTQGWHDRKHSPSGLNSHGHLIPEDLPGKRRLYNILQKTLFNASSRLTDRFPRSGSRFLDLTVRPLAGNPLLSALSTHHNRRVIRGLTSFRSFLVVPDIHIGDAVVSQSALTAIRDFFPEARVDYVVNRTVYPLLKGNPEATHIRPLFSNSSFISTEDLLDLRDMIQTGEYDLVLNFNPYLNEKDMGINRKRILNFLTYAPTIVRNENRPSEINHFTFQIYHFTWKMLSLVAKPQRPEHFMGLRLTLGDRAVEEAQRFTAQADLTDGLPIIMFNPDASSPLTRMPLKKSTGLLARIARLNTSILVAAGHTERGIGKRLIASLPDSLRSKTRIVQTSLPLEAFAALIDICDVFVSGDTGPLHIAAARKFSRSGRHKFRNRTAVLSIFGATPARMSGYDSFQPGYLPANQDAPSWSYSAQNPCRNITCVNKIYKTCRTIRCFDEVNEEKIAELLGAFLRTLSHQRSSSLESGR